MRKRTLLGVVCLFFLSVNGNAGPIVGYTHLLPGPRTLPQGRLAYGTVFAFGVTDFLQVSTNVLRDAFKLFNAQAKLSVIGLDKFALTPFVSFETYNLKDVYTSNPDRRFTSWQPGVVTALELFPELSVAIGGNLNYQRPEPLTEGIETSGYLRGAMAEIDLSWAYLTSGGSSGGAQPREDSGTNPEEDYTAHDSTGRALAQTRGARKSAPRTSTGKLNIKNAVSAGVSYDFTYDLVGLGISHHWKGFQLGVHYYPTADRYKFLPIVTGGGSVDF
jgi:hypothetical protein